jgi:hypothetical protein
MEDKKEITLEEFLNMLATHTWSVECTSYMTFIRASRAEQELFRIAMAGGPRFVEALANAKIQFLKDIEADIRNSFNIDLSLQLTNQKNLLEGYIETGDAEFDAFRKQVREHDYYYDFSDSATVYKHGEEQRRAIETIVREKGGLYETYWKKFIKDRTEASWKMSATGAVK